MNKLIAFSILFFSFALQVHAQESEYAEVEKTLRYYLDGGTNNDFSTLKKAFHETATMKFVGEEYKEVNALEFFGSRMEPGLKQDRETRIAYINISGTAANAKLELEYADATLIDYMNLLKIDGEWKVVSKIFSKK